MSTAAQMEANRRNALKSTGPKTEAGKAISCRNALKHGVHTRHLILPFEDEKEYRRLARTLRQELDPLNLTEALIVENIISAAWRLHRSRTLEASLYYVNPNLRENSPGPDEDLLEAAQAFRNDCQSSGSIDAISRHESRLERAFYRALRNLYLLRACSANRNSSNEPNAIEPDAHINSAAPTT